MQVKWTALCLPVFLALCSHAQSTSRTTETHLLSSPVTGDEPAVVTHHSIQTAKGILEYEARVGRIAIRNDENGEIHGYAFYVAYVVKPRPAEIRPISFLWNGGPTSAAYIVHTEMFGPRRITPQGMVDNKETLLLASDLVFFDPIETGYSRPAKPEFEKEFLSVLGDFAETTEFIRAFRSRFDVDRQPLFLMGESYGTWRASGVAEMLTRKHVKVAGVVLISGGVPGALMPYPFQDAMYVQARTAAMFDLKKLPPDLMRDKEQTIQAADAWAYGTYMPALERIDKLTAEEREKIAIELARFIGLKPEQVSRKSLVVPNGEYRSAVFAGEKGKVLNTYDMRIVGPSPLLFYDPSIVLRYLHEDLGYQTDLAYTGLEDGYMPVPGSERRSTGSRWVYDHAYLTPLSIARKDAGGPLPLSQPWLQDAMRINKSMKVYVAAGRYDSLNMCEGNLRMTGKEEPGVASRFTDRCYEGGHMMYRVEASRIKLSADLIDFVTATVQSQQGALAAE